MKKFTSCHIKALEMKIYNFLSKICVFTKLHMLENNFYSFIIFFLLFSFFFIVHLTLERILES